MTRTHTRSEILAILAVGTVALVAAVVGATLTADMPSVARIWPIVGIAVDYLAGFVVAAGIRAAAPRPRPSSIKGLAVPAIGYGLAISAATWGPGAMGSLIGHGPVQTFAAAAISAAAAVILVRGAWDADKRIDPERPGEDIQKGTQHQ